MRADSTVTETHFLEPRERTGCCATRDRLLARGRVGPRVGSLYASTNTGGRCGMWRRRWAGSEGVAGLETR